MGAAVTLRIAQAVDPAIGQSSRADYFVITTCGLDTATKYIHVLDIVRGRFEAPDQPKQIVAAFEKWHPYVVGVESIFYQTSLVQYLKRSTTLPIREIKIRGSDNETRLMGLAAHWQAGRIVLPGRSKLPAKEGADYDSAPWLRDLEEELTAIGWHNGKELHKHDDQAVAIAHCVNLLTLSGGVAAGNKPVYHEMVIDSEGW